MFVSINDYQELSLEETKSIDGGSLAILEAGMLIIGAAYGAGYAIGEFAYNITH